MSVFWICDVQSNGGGKKQSEASQPAKDAIEKYCSKSKDLFFDRKHEVWLRFNLEQEFEKNGIVLGTGAFGQIKEICYPRTGKKIINIISWVQVQNYDGWPIRVVVKKIKREAFNLLEAIILEKMNEKDYGLDYYGCNISQDENLVYLVQKKLQGDFSEHCILDLFNPLEPKKRLLFYKQLFEQVIQLNAYGYIHGDIKPKNIMFDSIKNRLVIIDFGTAQNKDTQLSLIGSQFYKSPGKYPDFNVGRTASLIDDLYSLAITIGVIEGEPVGVFSQHKKGHSCDLDMTYFNIECLKIIRTNVERILKSGGFIRCSEDIEEVKLKSVDELTFANLISLSINYFDFKLTGIEVMQIIDRELGDMKDRTLMLKFEPNSSELVCPGDQNHRLVI